MNNSIKVILFDLGGVLIELTGVPRMQEWMGDNISPEGVWDRWLKSETVRKFETGNSSADEFARSLVREFDLPVKPEEFLDEFTSWPRGLYPGAIDLLKNLQDKYLTASFTNTNPVHWARFIGEMGIDSLFQLNFPSHITGIVKPDLKAYENVLGHLGVDPGEMLFIDDNYLNVEPARELGLIAGVVSGLTGAEYFLTSNGIL